MSHNNGVTGNFLEVPGAQLYYEIAGEGKPIVFLHGGLLDSRMWDKQFKTFAQRYRAIRYDMRRSGQSKDVVSSTEQYKQYKPNFYQDLSILLSTLLQEPAILVGLSGGARFAIDLAIAQPELIHKLVLVSPGMSGYEFVDRWTLLRDKDFEIAASQRNVAAMVEASMKMWFSGPYRTLQQMPQQLQEQVRLMETQAISQNAHTLDIRELEPPAINRLAEIQAPTLIVLGDKDTSDIHTIGKLLHEQVKDAELVMMSDAGHLLSMEKPYEFNDILAKFL